MLRPAAPAGAVQAGDLTLGHALVSSSGQARQLAWIPLYRCCVLRVAKGTCTRAAGALVGAGAEQMRERISVDRAGGAFALAAGR